MPHTRPPLRLAILTLEAGAAARAVRRFVADWHEDIVMLGVSNPFRPQKGGLIGQLRQLLRRSGPRLLPYLALNFELPHLFGLMARPAATSPDTTPLRQLGRDLGLCVHTVDDVNSAAFQALLRELDVQAVLTFHFDQILSADTIAGVPGGGLNVHAGLLPEQRGPTPTISALLSDPPRFGVTLHRLVTAIDAGPVVLREEIALPGSPSALAAADALHLAALDMLNRALVPFVAGAIEEAPMQHARYRSFPSPTELRHLARSGRRTVNWADIRLAWQTRF